MDKMGSTNTGIIPKVLHLLEGRVLVHQVGIKEAIQAVITILLLTIHLKQMAIKMAICINKTIYVRY